MYVAGWAKPAVYGDGDVVDPLLPTFHTRLLPNWNTARILDLSSQLKNPQVRQVNARFYYLSCLIQAKCAASAKRPIDSTSAASCKHVQTNRI